MDTYTQYPERVTLIRAGVYGWRHAVPKEYERKSYTVTKVAGVIFALVMLILGCWLSLQNRDWKSLGITIGCVAGFLALIWLVCSFLDRLPGELTENYELTETYVKPGSWKAGYRFDFKDAEEVIVTGRYIELRAGTRNPRIYVPEEDMNFVRDYILGRVPGKALVRYQG